MDPEPPAQDVAAAEPAAPTPATAPTPTPPAFDVAARRAELTAEVQRARNWILAVGILLFTFDMFMMWAGNPQLANNDALRGLKYRLSLFDGGVLLAFVTLWWFAQVRPRLCCVIALILYWGLMIAVAAISKDLSNLFQGILVKILFTMALIRAIKNATNAEKLRADLAQVFA